LLRAQWDIVCSACRKNMKNAGLTCEGSETRGRGIRVAASIKPCGREAGGRRCCVLHRPCAGPCAAAESARAVQLQGC